MTTADTITHTLLVIVAVIVLLPVLMMAVMMPMMGGLTDSGMWGGGGIGRTWMWLLMWLVVLLVIGGIGYLLYTSVRQSGASASDPAIEELRVAYARGDLSEEEFERRHERLRRDE